MPLIIDPSSTCDICLENFTSSRECCCTPCGHVFCRECLNHLPQTYCPMCRASLFNHSESIRKIYVEIDDSDTETERRCEKFGQLLLDKTSEDSLSLRQVERLAIDVSRFRDANRSCNSNGWLIIIQVLLIKLAVSMVHKYDQQILSAAIASRDEDEHNLPHIILKGGTQQVNQIARTNKDQFKTVREKNGSAPSGCLHRHSQERTKKYPEKISQAERVRMSDKQNLVNSASLSQSLHPRHKHGLVKSSLRRSTEAKR